MIFEKCATQYKCHTPTIFKEEMVALFMCNKILYKISEPILSLLYNTWQPNLAILLILL